MNLIQNSHHFVLMAAATTRFSFLSTLLLPREDEILAISPFIVIWAPKKAIFCSVQKCLQSLQENCISTTIQSFAEKSCYIQLLYIHKLLTISIYVVVVNQPSIYDMIDKMAQDLSGKCRGENIGQIFFDLALLPEAFSSTTTRAYVFGVVVAFQ